MCKGHVEGRREFHETCKNKNLMVELLIVEEPKRKAEKTGSISS